MKRSEQIIYELKKAGISIELDMPGEGFLYWRTENPDGILGQDDFWTFPNEITDLLIELEQITTGEAMDGDAKSPLEGHTPAPWELVAHGDGNCSIRIAPDCVFSGAYRGGYEDTITPADGALIARSPVMYAALRAVLGNPHVSDFIRIKSPELFEQVQTSIY